LQFEKAEFAEDGPQCDVCKAAVPQEYYKLYSGRENVSASMTICEGCAGKVREEQAGPSHTAFVRGILYGAGMALACCIGYAAVIMISGLEIGLVAILVGYLVGQAVRKGSQGRGGRRCQIAAVVLTYFSITFAYIPVGIQQLSAAATISVPGTVGAVALLSGLAVISPFLSLTDGIGGMLGLFIIFLGLQRAWASTAPDQRQVTGPFQREATVG
jgi:hypothetical protein